MSHTYNTYNIDVNVEVFPGAYAVSKKRASTTNYNLSIYAKSTLLAISLQNGSSYRSSISIGSRPR